MNPKVDWFLDNDTKWQKEYRKLRTIVLECGLVEDLKWGVPYYTFQGKNVVLIHGFKEYCALLFQKGVLLVDNEKLLGRINTNCIENQCDIDKGGEHNVKFVEP